MNLFWLSDKSLTDRKKKVYICIYMYTSTKQCNFMARSFSSTKLNVYGLFKVLFQLIDADGYVTPTQ